MSSSDLQALFSNLRPRSAQGNSASSIAATSQPSSVFGQVRLPATPPPPFTSTLNQSTSFNGSTSDGNAQATRHPTAQNLLNLLNFSTLQSQATSNPATGSSSTFDGRQATINSFAPALDPVAQTVSLSIEFDSVKSGAGAAAKSTSQNPLLDLLNRQAGGSGKAGERNITGGHSNGESQPAQHADNYTNGNTASEQTTHPSTQDQTALTDAGKPIFTYTNPFEALNASRGQTPQTTVAQPQTPSFNFNTNTAPIPTSPGTISTRKKLTPKLRSQRSGMSPQPEAMPFAQEPTQNNLTTFARDPSFAKQLQDAVEIEATPVTEIQAPPVAQEQPQLFKARTEVGPNASSGNVEGQDGSGEWEDADESSDKGSTQRTQRIVPVYNFPIKAFVSITLQFSSHSDVDIREGSVMEISRLKKEFDQLDRSLAAATSKYITYAFTKHGGMRIIRQDDGSDRHVFKHSHDRVFNVALCTAAGSSPTSATQGVLGTGVSGSVYYATIFKEDNDLFESDELGSESLIFPPWPQADENTAGGVLKTRAKRSSRHPEFFAIGRGKSIYIIWPSVAASERYGVTAGVRTVDVEKYYRDRPLQIQTGKAGKDFTFSEDDSMIVSLDKTGRLRFWDIRALVDPRNAAYETTVPSFIDAPVLSLSTASPAEKSWPTSVLFVDKARPYTKGGALRYVLVGLRQNHTLQLWDIALGKAVQELNFPHQNETDGICSVSYHPPSGIIVVGHPTRNSIFFIHLSAPRYNLTSQLSQAAYVTRIASKDGDLPRPESTACMSGIREISFADKGDLRSVELLSIQKGSESTKSADTSGVSDQSPTLFELYIAHSRGVTCLAINKEDLGWNSDSKVVHGIDAQKIGVVTMKDLKLGSVIEEPVRTKSPVREVQQPSKSSKKKAKKTTQAPEEVNITTEEIPNASDDVANTTEMDNNSPPEVSQQEAPATKETKKHKKKPVLNAASYTKADSRSVSPNKVLPPQFVDKLPSKPVTDDLPATKPNLQPSTGTHEDLAKELQIVEEAVFAGFRRELEVLQKNISDDRASLDQSSLTRQEAIIRLVSSDLSTNVEKSLSRIITQQIQVEVLPNLKQITTDHIEKGLNQHLRPALAKGLTSELPLALASSLESTLTKPAVLDKMAHKLSSHLEKQIGDSVVRALSPLCKSIAETAASSTSLALKAEFNQQIQQLREERAADQLRLDRFANALQSIANTLQTMSDTQATFQDQILRDHQLLSATRSTSMPGDSRQGSAAQVSSSPAVIAHPTPTKPRTRAELELDEISDMMDRGQYEAGTIKWLQSSQPVQLFDEVFVRYTPDYLATEVSPLVAFSVAVTVANALNTHIDRRLEWISSAFNAVDPMDPELTDLTGHAPALISAIIQKLESLYMTLAERQHDDPILKMIPALVKKAREMRHLFLSNGQADQL